MRENGFTPNALKALEQAKKFAKNMGHGLAGTEHILLSLLSTKGVAGEVLRENKVNEADLLEMIEHLMGTQNNELAVVSKAGFTPRAKHVIEQSKEEAAKMRDDKAGTEHLLLSLLKEKDSIAVRLLSGQAVNLQKVFIDTLVAMGEDANAAKNEYMMLKSRKRKSMTPMLDQYCRDLTFYAKEGKLDPVIGRNEEITRLEQILCRRTKNNPCLVGEPGVGKTAVVEGLAEKIATGDVPEIMQNKRVMTLDLSGMVAGSKYRGEFEERIKRTIKEVSTVGNVLLFIDEIHTIIGAGGAEGALDAANILKPALARGEIQIIGATTLEEYRKHIEKDAALERRLQPVTVEEPTEEETIQILHGLSGHYESHHRVKISDEAIVAAVKLSARYVNDRFMPDKAIDVMDEACSRAALSLYQPTDKWKAVSEEYHNVAKEKEDAILAKEFEKAGELKKTQDALRKKLDRMQSAKERSRNKAQIIVGESEVAEVVADWTKIPVQKLQEEETKRLQKLEEILHGRVVGQDEAVTAVAKAVRRGRVGLKDPNRPIGSFLFLGPTGVGKTELSKALAEAVFGQEKEIIRVDMSEYMEKHSVSKMIGSPPGYVGYEDGGQLSEKVRRHPYSVVLFDEIEKAHPDVFNILLQVLEDGHITDAQGRKVSFKNTIIIMTSNAGAGRIVEPKRLGFGALENVDADYKKMKDSVMEEVKKIFKPEFINRIDEIIVFHVLQKKEIMQIVRMLVDHLVQRAFKQMGITLTYDDAVIEHIAESGYDKSYGARPIRRAIQTKIEDELAEEILLEDIHSGDTINISYDKTKITFSKLK